MTRDSQIFECVKDNIVFLGYDCELLSIPILKEDFEKKSFLFKLKFFFKIKIARNKKYINKYGLDCYEKNVLNKINRMGKDYEFSLLIRPDLYSKEIINVIVNKIKNTYAYQWDGLDRFPKVLNLIPKFDHFYIYDKKDLNRFPNTTLTTNFYIDCYDDHSKTNLIYDVYYLGVYDGRIQDVISLCSRLFSLGLKMKILIYCSKKDRGCLEKYPFIEEIHHGISYRENLENVFKSNILLDFKHENIHSGLSLRPLEAIGYSKKIITTNEVVKEYDFYKDHSILLLDKATTQNEIEDFIVSKIKLTKKETREKYSFSNWLENILEK